MQIIRLRPLRTRAGPWWWIRVVGRVIFGELRERPVAEQKRLRVADVRESEIAFGNVERREARGHGGEREVGAAVAEDFVIRAPVKKLALLDDIGQGFGVGAHIPASITNRQLRQRAERDAAGARSSA